MVALLADMEARLAFDRPVRAYLAGGMAVHLYTGQRVTAGIDIEFAARILVPNDLVIEVNDGGAPTTIYVNVGYSPKFSLLHGDYPEDALPVLLPLRHLDVRVLSPVDLAISKVARFADHDRNDIAALVRQGLTSSQAIAERGAQALTGYAGRVDVVRLNLTDAVALAEDVERQGALENSIHVPGG
jgi:hypothetical protein